MVSPEFHAQIFCSSFFCISSTAQIKPRQNTFPSLSRVQCTPCTPLYPLLSTSLHQPAAQWSLCSAGNLSLTPHHAFLPPPNFTSLDISQHTHVLHQGRETSPENDFPPDEERRRCPSPSATHTCFGGDFV